MIYNNILYKARRAELRSDWHEARRLWLLAGRKSDAQTCKLIIDAVALGDKFRSLVEQKLQTAGLPSAVEMPMCPVLNNILREAHQEVYDG